MGQDEIAGLVLNSLDAGLSLPPARFHEDAGKRIFELTAEVEQLLSGLYLPMLSHLVRVFANDLPANQLRKVMRQAGKSLAGDFPGAKRSSMNRISQSPPVI